MYYPSYEDYMRDVFYFNGLSNPNSNNFMPQANMSQNLNSMYPSIYKIVYPVIQKVIAGNNYQFVNEETVNNIVDVVIGITAGDINNMENNEMRSNSNLCSGNNNVNNNSNNASNNSSNNLNNNGNNSSNNCSNIQNNQINNSNNRNPLLRDLVKILVIRELISRCNVRRFPFGYEQGMPTYYNQSMPYMMN